MKVFFVSPHDWFLEHPGDRPPLGIACLSSYLKSIGHGTRIFDLNHETKEELMEAIKSEKPEMICLSVSTPNYNSCINLAKEIRSSGFAGLLVAGGNHVTDVPNEKPTVETFDYVVVGDGESGLKKIIEERPNIKIIVSRPVENLDLLPFPDYEGIKLGRYSMLIAGERSITISSSRGCVYGCVFCLDGDTLVVTSDSSNKKLKDVQVGDKLIAFDKGQFVETVVREVFMRSANQILEITLEDGRIIKATPEHPFYINDGWIDADKIKIGDILHHITPNDKISFNKKLYNPMKIEEVAKKMGAVQKYKNSAKLSFLLKQRWEQGKMPVHTPSEEENLANSKRMKSNNPMKNNDIARKATAKIREKRARGELIYYLETEEGRKAVSERQKIIAVTNNPMSNPEVVKRANSPENQRKRFYNVRAQIENKEEAHLNEIIQGIFPEQFLYTSFFKRQIGTFFPDWVHVEKKKIIEFFGCFWHKCRECGFDGPLENDTKRLDYYAANGYETLVIWGHELEKGAEYIVNKVGNFITNGLRVVKIRKTVGKFGVYNLNCKPYNNFFANYVLVHNCGSAKIKKWRPRSPENVVRELELLVSKYDIRAFYFVDDIFSFNKQRVYEICSLVKQRLPPIKWRATTRVDLVDYELLKEMKSAGCDVLSFGLESGNEQILRNIRKGASLERTRQAVQWCHGLGIKVKGFFIIGLPGETRETAQQTIEFAKSLKIEYCDFYPLTPFPATPIWENPQNFGMEVIKPENSNWENYYQVGKGGANQILIKHNNLTEEEILEFCKRGREAIKEGMTYY